MSAQGNIRILSRIAPVPSLRIDEVHVCWLRYRREQRRQPLRALLARYLMVGEDEVALVEDEHGRPRLASGLDASLDFNWSHSGAHAVIALARGIAPGIDIERAHQRPRALAIARRFFSATEADALAALPADQRDAAFLRLWTAKEAVLKAVGRGIAFGLKHLDIAIEDGQPRLSRLRGDDAAAWQVRSLVLDPELFAALAWRGEARCVRLFALDPEGG